MFIYVIKHAFVIKCWCICTVCSFMSSPFLLKFLLFDKAQARKAALDKVPEQLIISEVRKMVEEMQALNKKLEETEAAIEDYFKPIDNQAEMIMKAQLNGEEKRMREMMATMQRQALLEKAEAEKLATSQNAKADQHVVEPECSDKKSAGMG
ncbi:hypothetical protein ACS0TY_023436 [Phlomoides rotata]